MMALLLRLLNRCLVSSASKLQSSLLPRLFATLHEKDEEKTKELTTTSSSEEDRIKNEVTTCLAQRTTPSVLSEREFNSLSTLCDEMTDEDARAQIESVNSSDLIRTLLFLLREKIPVSDNTMTKDFCNVTCNALTLLTATFLFDSSDSTLEYAKRIDSEFSFFDIMHKVCNRRVDSDSLDVRNQFERVRRHAAECLRCLAKYSHNPCVFLVESLSRVKMSRTTRESFESLNEILKHVLVEKRIVENDGDDDYSKDKVAFCLCECLRHCYFNPIEDDEDEIEDEDINCFGTCRLSDKVQDRYSQVSSSLYHILYHIKALSLSLTHNKFKPINHHRYPCTSSYLLSVGWN